jgi:hypothetical protein
MQMQRNLIALALLLLLNSGCAKNIHPNQIDSLDGKTYDTLLVAQSVLDNAKIQFQQGKLPATSKPVINGMGQAYMELRELWLQYRAAPSASLSDKIVAASLEINRFILELRKIGVK